MLSSDLINSHSQVSDLGQSCLCFLGYVNAFVTVKFGGPVIARVYYPTRARCKTNVKT